MAFVALRLRRHVRLRGRLGLYVAPATLVVFRDDLNRRATVISRWSVEAMWVDGDDRFDRPSIAISARTPRGTTDAGSYGTVDLPADELEALLARWWQRPGLTASDG